MTYTLDHIPEELDRALRERAAAEKKSLDATILDLLAKGVGIEPLSAARPVSVRDLSDIAGTWEDDPEFDAILEEQNRIDPDMWT